MSIFHHKWAPFDLFVRFMLIIIRLDRRVFFTDFISVIVFLHRFCLDRRVSPRILFGSSCLFMDFVWIIVSLYGFCLDHRVSPRILVY